MCMVVIVVFTAYYNFLSALCGQGSQQATQDDHKQNKERHFVFGFVSAFVIPTALFRKMYRTRRRRLVFKTRVIMYIQNNTQKYF